MGVSKYFVPMSDERRMQHLARESEQAREDITNLQRQMDRPVGDIAPSGAGDGSEGFPLFIYGALTDTLQRGGDATLDAGGESDYDVVDSNDGLPGSITLPIGANLWARRHANEYHVIPPPWAFTLPNCTLPGGGINAGATGTVTTPFGNVTAHNETATKAVGSGWCAVTWDEDDDVWVLVNFDPDCDP